MLLLLSDDFFQNYLFQKILFMNTIRVPNILDPFCQSWYGSKLFAKDISRGKKSQLATKELNCWLPNGFHWPWLLLPSESLVSPFFPMKPLWADIVLAGILVQHAKLTFTLLWPWPLTYLPNRWSPLFCHETTVSGYCSCWDPGTTCKLTFTLLWPWPLTSPSESLVSPFFPWNHCERTLFLLGSWYNMQTDLHTSVTLTSHFTFLIAGLPLFSHETTVSGHCSCWDPGTTCKLTFTLLWPWPLTYLPNRWSLLFFPWNHCERTLFLVESNLFS